MGIDDVEAGSSCGDCCDENAFSNKAIRRGFIQKVFGIIGVQLAFVTACVLVTMLVDPVHDYLTDSKNTDVFLGLFISSIVVYFVTVIILACCKSVRRQYPTNLIILAVFTVASAIMISLVCSAYTVNSVMLALGITTACCVAIIIFSFNTKYDLSSAHGLVFCLLFSLLLTSVLLPLHHIELLDKIYAGIGALIFMFILVYDIHRIMGRSEENAISPEEYIIAALEIYLDIINIFIRILQIVGQR